MFRKMEQQIGSLFYHFWTNTAPRLDRYLRKGADNSLMQVSDRHEGQEDNKDTQSYRELYDVQQHSYGYRPNIVSGVRWKDIGNMLPFLRTPFRKIMFGPSMMEYLRRDFFVLRLSRANQHNLSNIECHQWNTLNDTLYISAKNKFSPIIKSKAIIFNSRIINSLQLRIRLFLLYSYFYHR